MKISSFHLNYRRFIRSTPIKNMEACLAEFHKLNYPASVVVVGEVSNTYEGAENIMLENNE